MDATLLAMLVCPACRNPLIDDRKNLICSNGGCRRRYRVRDEIPCLVIEKSDVMDVAAWEEKSKSRKAK